MSRSPTITDDNDPRAVAWREAQRLAGGNRFLAARYGVTSPAVAQWKVCPPERVLDIERLSGIPRYQLRPDVFGPYQTDVSGARVFEPNLAKALVEFGTQKMAEALGVPEEEINRWEWVPPTLVLKVEKLTGWSRYKLRPDVFGDAPDDEVVAA